MSVKESGMKSLLIRLREDIYIKLKAHCKEKRRSMVSYIQELIERDLG
jgi:predicted CopG family antitoxin